MATIENPATDGAHAADEPLWQRVLGLRASVFQAADPARRNALLPQLAAAERALLALKGKSTEAPKPAPENTATKRGNLLGPDTTKLEVLVELCMQPIPTAIYPLLTADTNPLLRVTVRNLSLDKRRVRVRAAIDSLSCEAVKTVEFGRKASDAKEVVIPLLPTLLPGKLASLTEVQRVTVYVIAEDLDHSLESHNTYSVVCLSRNTSFNAVRDASTGESIDFTRYYGAWVTPYDERVQACVRAAAARCDPPQIWGYQGAASDVDRQVKALFEVLHKRGITYVNSLIDYGAPDGYYTQRTRLPRESLARTSANCIDGAVLLASLIEGASLNPCLVIVPGHAFVGWETWRGSGKWRYLETTLIGEGDFDAACRAAQETYDSYALESESLIRRHSLKELRQLGIWPMT